MDPVVDNRHEPQWSAYEKLVMSQLAGLDSDVKAIDEKLMLLRIDVAQLKVKAGIWGAVAGMVPALITGIIAFVTTTGG
jgi:hypothetical protein